MVSGARIALPVHLARVQQRARVIGGLAGQQVAGPAEHRGGLGEQFAVALVGLVQVRVPVEGVGDQRGAPLEQLDHAGQSLVGGG